MSEIVYENWARVEADDMTEALPTSLQELSPQQMADIREMLASSFAQGMEAAFTLSDLYGEKLMTNLDAYNAGITEGKRELEGEQ